jgi:hypothetical protein
VSVASSDTNEAINAAMERRAFQIYEWTFTSLPGNRAALVEAAPPTPAPAPPAEATTPTGEAPVPTE